MKNPFEAGTGFMGCTEPGQKVTKDNLHFLPPGSVVRNRDNSRIIHLHDDIWLHCSDGSHLYDNVEHISRYLDEDAVACHINPNISMDES